ncbi:MAG: glycosyltransferase family 2 protein [Planctomycetota bacterium]|nr:glycosyltransferase family 2 protein [Planctomycetota bacterium]
MPRLSIIVPHLHDDSGLELTLLSILENRESDFEVLLAHDGRYNDPYGLDQDELILIESEQGASFSQQLNLAVASACSPIVQVLLPGSVVDAHWCEEALHLLQDRTVSAVCQPIGDSATKQLYLGLSGESLPHRRVTDSADVVAAPLLCGGVFRKRILKSIGGWLEPCTREVAEVEFALLGSAMDFEIEAAEEVTIQAPKRVAAGQESGYEIGRACGQLACAYSSIEESGVVIDSLARRLGHLAGGLMSPKTVAERLGWVMGIRDRTFVRSVQSRLELASSAMETERSRVQTNENRRAA